MATFVRRHRRKNGNWVRAHWRGTSRRAAGGAAGAAGGAALLAFLCFAAQAVAAGPSSVLPTLTGTAVRGTVVQVASESSRAAAQKHADRLAAKGYPAGVLRSDDYRELRRGWWVVYVGPYGSGTAGKAEAARVAKRFTDSRIRHITPRN